MIVVVASSDADAECTCARLRTLGIDRVQVVAPGTARRLVRAAVDDEFAAARLAALLRAEGRVVVIRPEAGVRLDNWMQHTQPLRFGDRLSVCFAWCEHDRSDLPGLIELGLGGFGNGEHAATRLVIEQLVDHIVGGERVLDVGCGSGVLGLCALELGAADVVAVDIKPEAIAATKRNATLNGMGDRVEATLAPLAAIDGPFDVVVANVGRAAVVALAPDLIRLVGSGGWLAVSGISPPQCSQLAEFLVPMRELGRRTSGEWSLLVVGHHGPPAFGWF